MVSEVFVCEAEAIASEEVVFRYEHLNGSWVRNRWYQPLWYAKQKPLPVRGHSLNTCISVVWDSAKVVLAAFVCEAEAVAGERTDIEYVYLSGSRGLKRRYQQL